MPVATVDPTYTEKKELKTAPPDGYVIVRKLPYGMKLERRDKASKMYMEAQPANRRRQTEAEVQRFELETLNTWATLFDFKYCIVDHNLTNVDGVKLDLGSPMTFNVLDPRIGSEIERILAEINDEDSEMELENFTMLATSSSVDGGNTQKPDTVKS